MIIVSLAVQAFFAGSEMGIISSNRIKISHRALKGDKRARHLDFLLENPEKLLATTLVGVNIAVIAGSSLASGAAMRFFGNANTAASVSALIMLPLVLIFGQLIPMMLARKNPTPVSLALALPMKAAYFILFPLVFFAGNLAAIFAKSIRAKGAKKSHFVTREELKLIIKEDMKKGVMDEVFTDMAYEIFDFGSTDAEDIMVPLKDVVSASTETTVRDIIGIIIETGYSWIPVYGEGPENISGVIKATDLLTEEAEKKALEVMRPCFLAKKEDLLEDILKNMQREETNFAVVADPNGKAVGIVTLEDIIEEIVGEIEDEYAPKRASRNAG